MKSRIILVLFILTAFSCSKEDAEPESELQSTKLTLQSVQPDCSQKFMTPALVEEELCFSFTNEPLRKYSIYVTAGYGGQVNYDRNVEVYITTKLTEKQNGITIGSYDAIIDTKIVKIPAYRTKSNNVYVFNDADRNFSGSKGKTKVNLVIANVKKTNGAIETCYLPRMQSPIVNNCFYKLPSNLKKYLHARNDDDFDNDGKTNNEDNDDDGDGLPDNVDDDDDNDGTPDVADYDDDNDGIPDTSDPDKKS